MLQPALLLCAPAGEPGSVDAATVGLMEDITKE